MVKQRSPLATLVLGRRLAANGTARRIRLEANLSLQDIADDIGCSHSAVLYWERGDTVPRGAYARRYAEIIVGLADDLGLSEGAPKREPVSAA